MDLREAARTLKETAEMTVFGIVMFFYVPYSAHQTKKAEEAQKKLANWEPE